MSGVQRVIISRLALLCTLIALGSSGLACGEDAPIEECSDCETGALCGNAALDRGEECDDGNLVAGDDCSSECRFEDACPMPWSSGQGTIEEIAGSVLGSRAVSPLPTHFPQRYGGEAATFQGLATMRWGSYPFAVNDNVAPDQDKLLELVSLFEQQTGKGVALYNHPSDLVVGADVTQILLNLEYGASLVTIALPPGWTPDMNLPIVVSGNPGAASNNNRLFQSGSYGSKYLLMPALSAGAGAPLIAAIHNTGGAASHGYHPRVMRDVGCALQTIDDDLGGDQQRVVFVGKSRGGGSALTWGANPLGLDYKTLGVFAHTPIWGNDFVMQRPVSIAPIPAMLAASATYGEGAFYESASPGRAEVVDTILGLFSPEGSFASVAQHQVAAHVEGLVNVPAVAVCIASHDQELLSSDGVGMLNQLENAGVKHLSEVVIRGAHLDCPATAEAFDAHVRWLLGLDASPPELSARIWSQEAALGQTLGARVLGERSGLPSWGIIPVAAEVNTLLEAHICGANGEVSVAATMDGTDLLRETRLVNANCEIFSGPAPARVGTISWTITLPTGDAAEHSIEVGRPLETRIFENALPLDDQVWSADDTRVAGYAVILEE